VVTGTSRWGIKISKRIFIPRLEYVFYFAHFALTVLLCRK
jgi:hypothetical protein